MMKNPWVSVFMVVSKAACSAGFAAQRCCLHVFSRLVAPDVDRSSSADDPSFRKRSVFTFLLNNTSDHMWSTGYTSYALKAMLLLVTA